VLPIPNQFGSLWVNFNSPLLWDVFGNFYLFIGFTGIWWTGLLPDLQWLEIELLRPFQKKKYTPYLVSVGLGRAKIGSVSEEVSFGF